jgi:hypothetical protein
VVEIRRITVPVFATELGVASDDIDDATLNAVTRDREAETYQFVLKAVRDDAEHAIDQLSVDLIDLSDRLLDESKNNAALRVENDQLVAQVEALEANRAINERDLANLRAQRDTIKRLLPGPLRRLLQKRVGLGSS